MGRVVSTQSIFFFFFFFFFCILHQYECQTLSRMKLQRSTDVEIPTSGAGASSFPKIHSLVELFGLLVKWSALLDSNETLDIQLCEPWRLLPSKGQDRWRKQPWLWHSAH